MEFGVSWGGQALSSSPACFLQRGSSFWWLQGHAGSPEHPRDSRNALLTRASSSGGI